MKSTYQAFAPFLLFAEKLQVILCVLPSLFEQAEILDFRGPSTDAKIIDADDSL